MTNNPSTGSDQDAGNSTRAPLTIEVGAIAREPTIATESVSGGEVIGIRVLRIQARRA